MNQQLRRLQQDGRCSKEGSHELFFSERPADLAKAQRICARCEVRVRCLDVAHRKIWSGVSGAESFSGTASLITGGVDGADRDMPSEIFLSKRTGVSSWSW